ncbi:MAG: hypothetical protein IKD05_03955 [Tidjanibacter sp.]|nr:hypothetical protein [Tidjanibacter sp.]MBR3682958.1 hypothetical protein [Tidjanibacter sp.]MBR3853639.1 hypothetical protein [Tidjanibacter sp.]MBR7129410.1 hypothetical protein [Tidjanibacter sp.]
MEVIKEDKKSPAAGEVRIVAYRFGGVAMILLGLVWLCYNYDLLPAGFYDVVFSWQMGVILVGAWLLATRNWVVGGVTTGVGVLCMLIDLLNIHISFTELVLPLALVATGVACLFVKPSKAK